MTLATAYNRMTMILLMAPPTPRLRTEPTGSRRTLLDGGWWPRSTDPVMELPGLVLAIDRLRGPITRLVLSADGWDSYPRRLGVAGRVLRLGYFASQPASLLTALCDNGDRVDLLVISPDTAASAADAAMVLAATTGNIIPARRIVQTASAATRGALENPAEDTWEAEGGHLGPTPRPMAGGSHQPVRA